MYSFQSRLRGSEGRSTERRRGRVSASETGSGARLGGSVRGEGSSGFGRGEGCKGGGKVSRPSRCMRSRATRALMSLRPPSGLRQSSASQTARDSAARERRGWRCASRARMHSRADSGKSRPQ